MLHQLLKAHFGYDQFRPLQEEIIAEVVAGRDALVLMPTGGGKSLCYQVPALVLPGVTLVVSPLIALMKDQVDALKANGVAAESLHSALPPAEAREVERRLRAGEIKLLYVSPERLAVPGFQSLLDTLTVSLLAIDEAHCISEWGHDFRPDYRNLKALRQRFASVPVIALTATATEPVREDIVRQLGLDKARTFLSSFNRANLSYAIKPKVEPFPALCALLNEHAGESAIVYCFSRKDVENLAAKLVKAGFTAVPYHAGLSPETRQENQEKFIRDEVDVVVATIAFGMGIDKPDIRLVVHYDLPKSLEGYYQETGRAGRDGLPSQCVLFYTYADSAKQEFFLTQMSDPAEQARAKEKLRQMLGYCQLHGCRRAHLLRYFGEAWEPTDCGACDNCLQPVEMVDATEIAKKILSAVLRTGQRFGAATVAGVLLGHPAIQAKYPWMAELSVFGIVSEYGEDELKQFMRSLAEIGYLERSPGEYPVFAVSGAGKRFLVGNEPLALPKPHVVQKGRKAKKEKLGKNSGLVAEADQELFQKLRDLRKRLADELGVPPFVVFGDVSLRQMAAVKPRDLDAFAGITGVGEKKLAQFGETFLAEINASA